MADIDIHRYGLWIERTKRFIQQATIPEENKELILGFDRMCLASGLSIPRRAKLMRHIVDVAKEFLPLPFTQATRKDLQDAVARIEAREGYSPFTKRDVKITLRKFFKWLVFREEALTREEYPEIVSWIRPSIKKRDRCRVRAADLLTAEEVERMIQMTRSVRDRAIVALLYEMGARIGELGTLTIGRITRDEYSFLLDLDGKTGKRPVRIVLYANHLVAWLNTHPDKHNPQAPLWPSLRPGTFLQALRYPMLRFVVQGAAEAAGIRKRIYPHLFRHSRVTHVLASGMMNESQAKVYFGWVPDSTVLSTYVHLVAKDANDAVLRMYGIRKQEQAPGSMVLACGMCETSNPRTAALCYKCGYSLGVGNPEKIEQRKGEAEDVLLRFLQKPEVRDIFKKMIHEESSGNSDKTDGPPCRSVVVSATPRACRPAGASSSSTIRVAPILTGEELISPAARSRFMALVPVWGCSESLS